MNSKSDYTLGIDLGIASIGWAAVSTTEQTISAGVRIFPAGTDGVGTRSESHPNQDRRTKRGARRRVYRKAKRKTLLRQILAQIGWMPNEAHELVEWQRMDVYHLRAKAISEEISLPELGRIIYHLNQRRGFLSLRKSELAASEGTEKAELEGMLGEIKSLNETIEKAGDRSLGNHLAKLREEGMHPSGKGTHTRLRGRHFDRGLIHSEFSLVWETQKKFHPAALTDSLRYGTTGKKDNPTAVTRPIPRIPVQTLLQQFGLENITFLQRSVWWPETSVGKCEHEKNQNRAPLADRRFQEFRMLSELNNLRMMDSSDPLCTEPRPLKPEERAAALTYLRITKGKTTLAGIRKAISKVPGAPLERQITFNLENNNREKISGLTTEHAMSKALGEKFWKDLPEKTKNDLVQALTLPRPENGKVTQPNDDETVTLLLAVHPLTPEQIEKILKTPFPSGYGSLSIIALEKLLPHMREGKIYQAKEADETGHTNSALHLAGYQRRDNHITRTFDTLPLIDLLTNPKQDAYYEKNFPLINNPLVLRSLHELRKVVNGIIRTHGKPTRIHLEMARSLKMNAHQREEHAKKTKANEKSRDTARATLLEYGVLPTRDALILLRLWEEQDKTCIYSGKPISITQLLSGQIEVDHIYPRGNHDDSYMNKVVSFATENATKSNRLPAVWLSGDTEKYESFVSRANKVPLPKRERLLATSVPEGFAARDLNDTAYMATAAKAYLSLIVEAPHHVFCPKGAHTAFLRKNWNLHDLLRNDGQDFKNREDHRHHALDAIVIALSTPSLIQRISKNLHYKSRWKDIRLDNGEPGRAYRLKPVMEDLTSPWENLRDSANHALEKIRVSHRANRKLSGKLHEETNYGATSKDGVVVRRKNLASLQPKEIEKIRDENIRRIVRNHIESEGALFPTDFSIKQLTDDLADLFAQHESINATIIANVGDRWLREMLSKKLNGKNPLIDAQHDRICMSSGIPIRRVRLLIPDKTARPLRKNKPWELVIPGNNHHFTIFTLGDGKCLFAPITLLDVLERKSKKLPIIDRIPPVTHPQAEFLMYLCGGDSILVDNDTEADMFVFKTISSTSNQASFIHHQDARQDNRPHPVTGRAVSIRRSAMPNTFLTNFPNPRKVEVLPHGEIREIPNS